jgi:hypothetical protein
MVILAQKRTREAAGREFDVGRDTDAAPPGLEFVIEWLSRRYSRFLGEFCKLENIVSVYLTCARLPKCSYLPIGVTTLLLFSLFLVVCTRDVSNNGLSGEIPQELNRLWNPVSFS